MPDDEEIQDDDEGMEKGASDLDFVKERLADESGGVEALSQALESIQDPKLKEIIAAIHEDEAKHQAALQQWMQENGGGEGEEEAPAEEEADTTEKDEGGDVPAPDEEDLDEDDGGKGELIDQIRAILEEHDPEMEKADDEEAPPDEEDTEKSDDGDEDDKPDFLKEDEEDEEEETEKCAVHKFMPIIKLDNEQHKACCIVARPGEFDLQGDRTSKAEIEKAAHRFMERMQKTCSKGVGYNHEMPIDAYVVENVIAPQDVKLGGQIAKAGTWYQWHKIEDDKIWKMIKSGEITGLSRQGQGVRTPLGKGILGNGKITKSGQVRKGERFELSDEEIDRVDWVHKGANGATIAIIKFVDQKSKEGIKLMKTKPAGARAGSGVGQVTKSDIAAMISEEIQKAVRPLVETVQKQSTKMRKQELEVIAKSYLGELGNPSETATILKSLEDSDMSAGAKESILKTLKQANAAKKEAMGILGSQMGSSRPAPGSATAQFEAIVAKHDNIIQKSGNGPTDPKVRNAMAVAAATRENGKLAKAVIAEERQAAFRMQAGTGVQ